MFRAAHRAQVMLYLEEPGPERAILMAGSSVLEGATAEETKQALRPLDLLLETRLKETVGIESRRARGRVQEIFIHAKKAVLSGSNGGVIDGYGGCYVTNSCSKGACLHKHFLIGLLPFLSCWPSITRFCPHILPNMASQGIIDA